MTADDLFDLLESLGLDGVVRRNQNIMACCPFHQERRPSWGISVSEPHLYGCFACGAKGNLGNLLVNFGWSADRVRKLIGRSDKGSFPGMDVTYVRREARTLNNQLLYPFELRPEAVNYLRRRGITQKVIVAAGILYDHLQYRVLFPWNYHGRLIGLTGRTILDNARIAKTLPYYGMSKEGSIYLPFGAIQRFPLYLVEGEIDALKLASSGYSNVCGLCFGSFTPKQKNLLVNSAATAVVLCFDDDETGERLTQEAVSYFSGKLPISRVDYAPFRSRYKGKLDPGAMTRGDIERMLVKVRKNIDWPEFKLGLRG